MNFVSKMSNLTLDRENFNVEFQNKVDPGWNLVPTVSSSYFMNMGNLLKKNLDEIFAPKSSKFVEKTVLKLPNRKFFFKNRLRKLG